MKFSISNNIILLLLVGSISLARRHPHVRPRGRAALRVQNGYNDTEGKYPYVVCLVSDLYRHCTGSLISSNWVLTAAHCHKPYIEAIQYGDMTVPPAQSTTRRRIIKFIKPDFYISLKAGRNTFWKQDIALARVDEARMGVYGSISSVDYRTLVGLAVEYAGYGYTRNDPSPEDLQLDFKRPLQLGTGVVRACPKKDWQAFGSFMCLSKKCNIVQEGRPGDSGGPLVYDGKIVGVYSGRRGHLLDISVYTPVSPYLDWIQNTVANYVD